MRFGHLSSVVIAIALLITPVAFAQSQATGGNSPLLEADAVTIPVGRLHTFESTILDEPRPIFIATPRGYQRGSERYPVLYVFDGEVHAAHLASLIDFLDRHGPSPGLGRIPPMIVVGIHNTDRMRDLQPAIDHDAPGYVTTGDADRFLRFLTDELIPHIDANYRTTDERLVTGHCLAGLFSLHALAAEPDVFAGAIAVTPYSHYDADHALSELASRLAGQYTSRHRIDITAGAESDEWVTDIVTFAERIGAASDADGRRTLRRMEDLGHGEEVHLALYDALRRHFADWPLPAGREFAFDVVLPHFDRFVSNHPGHRGGPELHINAVGYHHLQAGRADEAIRFFEYNAEQHPGSWNAHDSLGDGYRAHGRRDDAITCYRRSIELNPANVHGIEMLSQLGVEVTPTGM
jgi:predicted alpha/beta superfamily hydrolase